MRERERERKQERGKRERETEPRREWDKRDAHAVFAREITNSFAHSSFIELAAGLMVKFLAVCSLWGTMAKEVVCHWLLWLGSAALILHS